MGDSQGNPFIGNPFMQGTKKTPPVEPKPQRQAPTDPTVTPSNQFSEEPPDPSKKAPKPAAKKASKSSPKTTARTSSKRKRAAQSSPPPVVSEGNGYKVQVLAKIPMPTNTNMPSRDYLWFAVYPIIPRVGDCLYHDGRYLRVKSVFLYENTNAGWCADVEVSYYTRRQ